VRWSGVSGIPAPCRPDPGGPGRAGEHPAQSPGLFINVGSLAGEATLRDIPGMGRLTCVSTRDPEGNMMKLQRGD